MAIPVAVVGSGKAGVGAALMKDLGIDAWAPRLSVYVDASPDLEAYKAFSLPRSKEAAFGAGKKGIKPSVPASRLLRFVCWSLCARCRLPTGPGSIAGDIEQQGGVFILGPPASAGKEEGEQAAGPQRFFASPDEHPGYPPIDPASFLAAARA